MGLAIDQISRASSANTAFWTIESFANHAQNWNARSEAGAILGRFGGDTIVELIASAESRLASAIQRLNALEKVNLKDLSAQELKAHKKLLHSAKSDIAIEIATIQDLAKRGGIPADPMAVVERVLSRPDSDTQTAGLGSIAKHKDQGKAIWSETGRRLSESEHIWARKLIQQMTTDPSTGYVVYDETAYQNSTTLKISRETAVAKTRGDMNAIRAAKNAANSPNSEVMKGTNWQSAVDRTINAARGTRITEKQVNMAAHGQLGELHAKTNTALKGGRITNPLRNASVAEIDTIVNNIGKTSSLPHDERPIFNGKSLPSKGVKGAGATVFSIGAQIGISVLHEKAEEAGVREQAKTEGYVPIGEEDRPSGIKGILYGLGSWLIDPLGVTNKTVDPAARFNIEVWRERIRTKCADQNLGDTFKITWHRGECRVDKLGFQVISPIETVYERQADGKYKIISGNFIGVPDLNRILSKEVPNEELYSQLTADPCLA
jgi:hypothetical protein